MSARWIIAVSAGLSLAMTASAQEVSHHPSCTGPRTVAPSGGSVASFLAAPSGEQARVVRAVMDTMTLSLSSTNEAACTEVFVGCLADLDERVGTAVAQGYLTGRVTLAEHDAAAGIDEALEQYCLGTWTPGSP